MHISIRSPLTGLLIVASLGSFAPLGQAAPLVVAQVSLQQQAEAAYSQGDGPRAAFLYAQLLQQQPNNYQFQVRLAFSLLNSGPEELNNSYVAFQRAREINPNVDEPWLYLGRLEEALERPQTALANYQQALQINPNNQEAFAGARRVQSLPALPALPENLAVIENRPLSEYVAAVDGNSRVIQGLRAQQSIVQNFAWRGIFPGVSLGYSRSNFDSESFNPTAPIFSDQPFDFTLQRGTSRGDSNGFSVSLGWNTADIFLNENQLRARAYEDDIANNLRSQQLEVQRLYALRSSLLEEFRQLAWQSAINPTDRTIRYNRRDRYMQLLYVSQQLHAITGLY